jgi:Flp pilus assembly protein TadB
MQLKDVAPSYGLACLIAVSVWFLKYLPLSYWVILPLQIVVGMTVFFTACKLTKMREYEDAKELLDPFMKKIRRKK